MHRNFFLANFLIVLLLYLIEWHGGDSENAFDCTILLRHSKRKKWDRHYEYKRIKLKTESSENIVNNLFEYARHLWQAFWNLFILYKLLLDKQINKKNARSVKHI